MNKEETESLKKDFYSRQTVLKELGESGQKKLAKAKVAVVGVGGLGTVSSLYLTLAGVGYLRLIDQDTVELQNLHRQILYNSDDIHYPKVEVATRLLHKQNSLVKIEAVTENVNASNVERLLTGVDCVVDGLDNMVTRYLVNRACVKLKIPYVFGAAIGIEGNLSVFSPPETGCLECLMPNLSDSDMQTCGTRGVIGATPGIIGSLQAMETIKLLANVGTPLKNKLLVCDFNDMDFTTIDISKSNRCSICRSDASEIIGAKRLVWLCGKETANINPETPLMISLQEASQKIANFADVRLKSKLALMFLYKSHEVTLFQGGRMLIKGVKNETIALGIYNAILEKLETGA